MQRREFLAASAAAAVGLVASGVGHAAESESNRMLIELRIYNFANPEKQSAFAAFLGKTAIPAFNRAGVEPVGAFKLLAKDNGALHLSQDSTDLYVVLPYKNVQTMIELEDKLAGDQEFQQAGKEILNAPTKDAAYTRYQSSLLYSFPQFPTLQVPNHSPDRLIQLRRYESHNRERAIKKVKMFNEGGELAVFKRSGMTGVFFGEALIGDKLPNLTYMLSFENDEAQKQGWANFGKDPDWKKLSKDEEYKDTVSTITNLLLRPVEGSQI